MSGKQTDREPSGRLSWAALLVAAIVAVTLWRWFDLPDRFAIFGYLGRFIPDNWLGAPTAEQLPQAGLRARRGGCGARTGPYPHDLRDTAATLAFSAGASVKEVANMLGHANPAITLKRYTGVLESMRARTDQALEQMYREAVGLR